MSNNLKTSNLISVFKNFLKSSSIGFDKTTRKQYICYKAILTICDWLGGSAHQFPEEGIFYNKKYLEEKIVSRLKDEGKTDIAESFAFRQFQVESIVPDNVIAIAPHW